MNKTKAEDIYINICKRHYQSGAVQYLDKKIAIEMINEALLQANVIKSVCSHLGKTNTFGGSKIYCLDCGEEVSKQTVL